ncbi:MAG TPA: alpha/beta hydrolase [Acidimicrobiales bacterium]
MVERIDYDEFSYFHENAEEFGLPFGGPPVVRRETVPLGDGRNLSALMWGDGAPELVLLHGGAQNAHTWDTVAMALGRPLVAIDLPGHGHSDGGRTNILDQMDAADDVATTIRALAPEARGVVGMSFGGMVSLALSSRAPELVRKLVLVDVTPGVTREKSAHIAAFVNGPETFASFDELLARTIEHNPTRTESSLRRGILHNAEQQADGTWVWRHRRFRPDPSDPGDPHPSFNPLWDAVSELTVPLMLVRGMRDSSVVDDADEAEVRRRQPSAVIERIEDAGHSVQGDTPLELAALLEVFVP